MVRLKWSFTLVVLALVAGCKVGPEHQPPLMALPGTFQYAATNEVPAITKLEQWWTFFDDPELTALIEEAAAANHDLRLAQARVGEARALRGIARASLWPEVNASGAYQRARTSATTYQGELLEAAGEGLTQDNWNAGFDLHWELDVFGGRQRENEAAQADLESAEDAANGTRVTVLAEVGLAYLDLRGYQRQLAVARENLRLQQETHALTRDRFQAGLADALDSARAATQAAATAATLPPLEQAILRAQHRLAVLLGRSPGELANRLVDVAPIPTAAGIVPVGLPSELLLRRPDIRRAEREVAAASARVGVATAEFFPKFYLTGAAGLQSVEAADFFDGGSRFWSLGPSLSWPVFNMGRVRNNVRVQNARHEQALIRYEQTVLTSLEEVENALVAFGKEQERLRALTLSEESARRAVALAGDRCRSGLVDFLSVLDAERSLQAAQGDVAASEQLLARSAVRLYQALGGDWTPPVEETRTAQR